MKIGIIGAGYAGVSGALEAARKGTDVTLFSNEPSLPYFRPRIIGLAFGQTSESEIYMHNSDWYSENNIKLLVNSDVKSIRKINGKTAVYSNSEEYIFDKVIISTGAMPIIPDFALEPLGKKLLTIWTLQDALEVKHKLDKVKTITIIGGGLIGLETALRAADIGIKVTILEKAGRLLENNFSPKGSDVIKRLFHKKGIDLALSSNIEKISESSNSINVITSNGLITSDIAILCIGCRPQTILTKDLNLKTSKGIIVDQYLNTSSEGILASGDAAEFTNSKTVYSVQRALAQGKVSGFNSGCQKNSELIKYIPSELSLDLKYKDFEIHSIGKIKQRHEENYPNDIIEDTNSAYRAVWKDNDIVYGIEMVGSSEDFNNYKKLLKYT